MLKVAQHRQSHVALLRVAYWVSSIGVSLLSIKSELLVIRFSQWYRYYCLPSANKSPVSQCHNLQSRISRFTLGKSQIKQSYQDQFYSQSVDFPLYEVIFLLIMAVDLNLIAYGNGKYAAEPRSQLVFPLYNFVIYRFVSELF